MSVRRTSDKLTWLIIAWLLLDKFGCEAISVLKVMLP
jgi:hypothetical protein